MEAGRSLASSTVVPTDTPTLEAALLGSADTVWVLPGYSGGSINVVRSVRILAAPGPGAPPSFLSFSFNFPGVPPGSPGSKTIEVRGLRIRGSVFIPAVGTGCCTPQIAFKRCQIDGDISGGGTSNFVSFDFDSCSVGNGVAVSIYYFTIRHSTIAKGVVVGFSHGNVTIEDNTITGPAAAAVDACCNDASIRILRNNISGTVDGIIAGGGRADGNFVHDITGTGLRARGDVSMWTSNTVVRAAGEGFRSELPYWAGCFVRNNVFEDIGGAGIVTGTGPVTGNRVARTGGTGLNVSSPSTDSIAWNQVTAADSDGIVSKGNLVVFNSVGHCGGSGIVLRSWPAALRSNTSYENLANGYMVPLGGVAPFQRNIAFGNALYGFFATSGSGGSLACNDWFGNLAGATSGVAPGTTDLAVDPRFCDVARDSVALASDSPLLNAPGCGQIGTRGVGCATPVGVPGIPLATSRVAFRATPNPALGDVRFGWEGLGGGTRIEVFDLAGQRRWSVESATGSGSLKWNRRDLAGRRLAAGIYLVRATGGLGSASAKLVLLE